MSAFYNAAEAIAIHLSGLSALVNVPVLVDRQKELATELRLALGKQNGALAVVSWAGASNDDLTAEGPQLKCSYTVTLFSKPVIKTNEIPADDVMEAMATALHDYRLISTDPHRHRLLVAGIEPIPHEELLIYQLTLTALRQL